LDRFKNVTAIKKANIYYDGKVSSRILIFSDGSKKTLGLCNVGLYDFATDNKEHMEIVTGALRIQLAGESTWTQYMAGDVFDIPSHTQFTMEVTTVTDYVCSYIPE
jgi:uncharacterized protein YaiE (UPF0345 family)